MVYLGVVNPIHLPTGQLFLWAGKPVLLEKPTAMNATEVWELAQEAWKSGVLLMEVRHGTPCRNPLQCSSPSQPSLQYGTAAPSAVPVLPPP